MEGEEEEEDEEQKGTHTLITLPLMIQADYGRIEYHIGKINRNCRAWRAGRVQRSRSDSSITGNKH
ncbi:hypothetical protein E2C01_004125 [Portunus trituberculatus]|uniref:Uncharacterized protein n=1 Tax=Portunus trituberculatus TaxID=210409 RepID=A0A5B7CQR3_PORTR|nr:hypothetical protein [Portunus trituberculatus]